MKATLCLRAALNSRVLTILQQHADYSSLKIIQHHSIDAISECCGILACHVHITKRLKQLPPVRAWTVVAQNISQPIWATTTTNRAIAAAERLIW